MLQKLRQRVAEEGVRAVPRLALRYLITRRPVIQIRQSWRAFKRHQLFSLRNRLLVDKPVRVRFRDHFIDMVPEGSVIASLWAGSRFERKEIDFVVRAMSGQSVFIDVGANAGIFSLAVAKRYPQALVYAVEPSHWTFGLLQKNIRCNNLTNVTAHRTAFGDTIGQAILHLNIPGRDGLNTLGTPSHPDSQVIAQEIVPIVRLDAFLEQHGISRVDVMKVDVEGAELLVFKGAEALLRRDDAPLILYEGFTFNTQGFGYHPVEIMWLLKDFGYLLYLLDSRTAQAVPRLPMSGYNTMLIAVKPSRLALMEGRSP